MSLLSCSCIGGLRRLAEQGTLRSKGMLGGHLLGGQSLRMGKADARVGRATLRRLTRLVKLGRGRLREMVVSLSLEISNFRSNHRENWSITPSGDEFAVLGLLGVDRNVQELAVPVPLALKSSALAVRVFLAIPFIERRAQLAHLQFPASQAEPERFGLAG